MDELVLKVRADTRGAKSDVRGIADETDNFKVSALKASTAVRGFVGDLAQAKTGADVASAALGAFGKILGTSIAGTAVVIAGKVLIDTWNKITDGVNAAKTAVADANKEIQKIALAGGFESAGQQAQVLQKASEAVRKEIETIEKSKLSSFIANLRGSKEEMDNLYASTKKQADELSRQSVVGQLIEIDRLKNLSESDKKISDIGQKYEKLLAVAREIGDTELQNSIILKSQGEQIEENARIRKAAEDGYQRELYKAEEEARVFQRKNSEELSKFRKELADSNREYESNLDQNAYDERVKSERNLRDVRISLYEEYVSAAAENEKKLAETRKELAQTQLELAGPTLEAAFGARPGSAGASFTGEQNRKRLEEIQRREDRRQANEEIERVRKELVEKTVNDMFKSAIKGEAYLGRDPEDITTRDAINELRRREKERAAQGGEFSEKIRERDELVATEGTLQAVKDLLAQNIETLTKYSTAE